MIPLPGPESGWPSFSRKLLGFWYKPERLTLNRPRRGGATVSHAIPSFQSRKPNLGNFMFREPLPTIRHKIYTPADVRNEPMISNERPSPFKGLPQMQPRSPVQENTLKSGEVQIERKKFVLSKTPIRRNETSLTGFVISSSRLNESKAIPHQH